jgi:hypothetical protein
MRQANIGDSGDDPAWDASSPADLVSGRLSCGHVSSGLKILKNQRFESVAGPAD